MKLVAVTRILNEDDIVEAFARHHRGMVDHHLFLDNGSVDRTVEILRALQDEGVPLTVLQNKAPFYSEVRYNTSLYEIAARNLGADWVLFLDADEFIDARYAPGGVRGRLAAAAADLYCVAIPTVGYLDMRTDDPSDLLAPRRIRTRQALVNRVATKLFVRASLAGVIQIEGGQHHATLNGDLIPSQLDDRLALAHYDRRGPYHALCKNVLGRLKVLAGGKQAVEKQLNHHYVETFETIRDAPERLLRDPRWLAPDYATERRLEDPIRYEGEELRFTRAEDGPMRAIRVMLAYGEQLARDFGELIDTNQGVRTQLETKALEWIAL